MLIVSSMVGILIGVGLTILGFRDAFLFGAISAVANVVPIVGPFSILVAPVLFAASEGNWHIAALTVVVNLSVQQLDAYVISPFVLRHTVAIHPVSGITGLLVFGALPGAPGVLLMQDHGDFEKSTQNHRGLALFVSASDLKIDVKANRVRPSRSAGVQPQVSQAD